MKKVTDKEKVLQWHPAFYAGMQIELAEEAGHLIFENEHQLGTKPKEIDVLIIKKDANISIKKNIGRIFRVHNIIEYKSPEDYLSIDDFYKVYGYACFYKSDTQRVDEIKAQDITISYVCKKYPYKVMRYLQNHLEVSIEKIENGIYYVKGFAFAIQLIVTSRLKKEENLWLHSLTNDLKNADQAADLLREYEKHRHENIYQSMMNVIVNANEQTFKEGEYMCEALMRIAREKMQEELEIRDAMNENRGKEIGKEIGKVETLISLVKDGLLSVSEAAKRLAISEEAVLEKMKSV